MFQRARRKLILPFLLPQTILFTLITLVPIIATVAYAFTDWQGQGNNTPHWAGLIQFRLITTDQHFLNAVKNSFFLMLVGGVLVFLAGILIGSS